MSHSWNATLFGLLPALVACGATGGTEPADEPDPAPCERSKVQELQWTDEVDGLLSPAAVLAILASVKPLDVEYRDVPRPPSRAVLSFTSGPAHPTLVSSEDEPQLPDCPAFLVVPIQISVYTDDGALAEDVTGNAYIFDREESQSFAWLAEWTRAEMRGALVRDLSLGYDVLRLSGGSVPMNARTNALLSIREDIASDPANGMVLALLTYNGP